LKTPNATIDSRCVTKKTCLCRANGTVSCGKPAKLRETGEFGAILSGYRRLSIHKMDERRPTTAAAPDELPNVSPDVARRRCRIAAHAPATAAFGLCFPP
jgi:hypothetical protein